MVLEVSGRNGEHQTGKPADGKEHHERGGEEHGCLKGHGTSEHSGYPVKHLHPCRDRDQHSGVHEKQLTDQRNTNSKHVVCPDNKRQKGDAGGGIDHGGIAKQMFAGKGRNNGRNDTEGGQNHYVHFGVAKEPEDVLEQHRITTTTGIEETGTKMDIHQHHGNCPGQYRHDRNQQVSGDQPGPDKQRHLHHGHARSTQVEDGRNDVNGPHN